MAQDFKSDLRIGVFDIEATDLDAQYGYMVCVSILEPLDDIGKGYKIHTLRIDDPRNPDKNSDKWLVKEVVKLLNSFDVLIGWNSSQYDIPFINTRAWKHRLTPPKRNFRRDLLFFIRANGRLQSNRLKAWDEFLMGQANKTRITPKYKYGCIRGEKWAINFYVDHCERDVVATFRIYKRFMPLLGKLRKA